MAQYNTGLRETLLTLAGRDIGAKALAHKLSHDHQGFNSKEFVHAVEQKDTEIFKEIISQMKEWPGVSMVGHDGALAAFLVAQHSDRDVAFQRECLKLMQHAAARGEMPTGAVAFLTDRVLINSGKPQMFGTQFHANASGQLELKPLAKPEHVNERRERVGLKEPVHAYLARMNAGDNIPFRELMKDEQAIEMKNKILSTPPPKSWEEHVRSRMESPTLVLAP